jgi:hypothetical protein
VVVAVAVIVVVDAEDRLRAIYGLGDLSLGAVL